MRCSRCHKIIREAYYVNGKPYGIECAKRRGYSDKKVIIKQAEEIDEKPEQKQPTRAEIEDMKRLERLSKEK
jgi:hypothetical protein